MPSDWILLVNPTISAAAGLGGVIVGAAMTGRNQSTESDGMVDEAPPKGSVDALERLTGERFPEFKKLIEYDNQKWTEELLPLYREMLNMFSSRMHLSESSTRAHYGTFVEFVEVWERWLGGALPAEVLRQLEHGESKLQAFYPDIEDQFTRLQAALKAG